MKTLYETTVTTMLALSPEALPALRIAATFFLIVNLIGGTYIFRNRHRFLIAIGTSTMTFRQFVA
jgi:hypothetical protein